MQATSPAPATAKSSDPSATALGKSISFRPGFLFADAEAYGLAKKAKTGAELNPSQVVCLALERLFAAENFHRPSSGATAEDTLTAELIGTARELGLPAALVALRKQLRATRQPAHATRQPTQAA